MDSLGMSANHAEMGFGLDVFLTGAAAFSTILYVIFLLTLRHFRKKEPFNSPFFTICVSLGVCDISMLTAKYLILNAPHWGIIPELIWGHPPWYPYPRLGFMLHFHLQFGQYIACILLAWNRFTAFVIPFKYEVLWSSERVKLYLLVQWLGPLIMSLPILGVDLKVQSWNNQTGEVFFEFTNFKIMVGYFGVSALFGTVGAAIISILYVISIYKYYVHRKRIEPNVNEASSLNQMVEAKLLANGCAIFTMMLVYVMFFWGIFLVRSYGHKLRILFEIAGDIYCWNNVYILLILNAKVRHHFKCFILRKNPDPPTKTQKNIFVK